MCRATQTQRGAGTHASGDASKKWVGSGLVGRRFCLLVVGLLVGEFVC
jgi:hypothetical protein